LDPITAATGYKERVMAVVVQETSEASPSAGLRHLKVTGHSPAFGYEACEDAGCTVDDHGHASSCGREACPACGCSGTNLSSLPVAEGVRLDCTCGFGWLRV
jgi:hypothetical protein